MWLSTEGNPHIEGTLDENSDRNVKTDFEAVDCRQILATVAALPITEWAYIKAPGVRHVGPMAQDFHAAFGLGEDDKHITTVDRGGVALAAIQGLNQKVEEEGAALKAKDVRIAALEQDVAELKALVTTLLEQPNRGGSQGTGDRGRRAAMTDDGPGTVFTR
jgi:hypothetical protein